VPSTPAAQLTVTSPASVLQGETLRGEISGVPSENQVLIRLISSTDPGAAAIDCIMPKEKSNGAFSCEVPADTATGQYILEVRLLDLNGRPIVVNGRDVVDRSTRVAVSEAPASAHPVVRAQYSITAAGYVMPVSGRGFTPGSMVTLSAEDSAGEKAQGVTFFETPSGMAPTPLDVKTSLKSVTVIVDRQGNFSGFMSLNPYMPSTKVTLTATELASKKSVHDDIGVLGEPVAELSTSPDALSDDSSTLRVTGAKFAPYCDSYPVELRLMRGSSVVARQRVGLTPPTEGSLWSTLDRTDIDIPTGLEPGIYTLQAVVPSGAPLSGPFERRVLASKSLTVRARDSTPLPGPGATPSPSSSASPSPSETTTPKSTGSAPVPSPSAPLSTATPTSAPTPAGARRVGPLIVPWPLSAATQQAPSGPLAPLATLAPPVIKVTRPETPRVQAPLPQNPVWLQKTAFAVDDPRVVQEPNQKLKSSAGQTFGSRGTETKIEPKPSASMPVPGVESQPSPAPSVITVQGDLPWWPIAVLTAVALGVGLLTGSFLARGRRGREERS
jgi:hypothetical protein